MIAQKRGDTKVSTIEAIYHVHLNTRGDMLLRNLLQERGFSSLSKFIRAYRGLALEYASKRRLFLSFDYEDRQQVAGFRLMAKNRNLDFAFSDLSLRTPVDSEESAYVKRVITKKIFGASVVVCLIGNRTASSEWVAWEIKKAIALRKGVCGVRLRGSRGTTPPALVGNGSVARWDLDQIMKVIEQAAARRS
jgi:hypothetical protein